MKKNEELKSENENLKQSDRRTREKAEAEVKAAKADAQIAVIDAETRVQKAIGDLADRESKVSISESKIEWEVGQRAGKIIREFERKLCKNHEERQKQLSKQYQAMTIKYKSVLYASLLYGIITMLITAIQSEVIRSDFLSSLQMLGYGAETIALAVYEAIKTIASVTNHIPNEAARTVLYWLVIILLLTAFFGTLGIVTFIGGRKYIRFFNENQKDELTVFVCLMILAVVVFASELIKMVIPINIVCLMLIAFGVYSGMRGVMEMKDNDTQYKLISGMLISAIGVAVTILLIHMIGGWVIIALPIALMFVYGSR